MRVARVKVKYARKWLQVRYVGETWRVGGLLALSRAFGNAYMKGSLQFEGVTAGSDGYASGFGVIAEPSVQTVELADDAEWVRTFWRVMQPCLLLHVIVELSAQTAESAVDAEWIRTCESHLKCAVLFCVSCGAERASGPGWGCGMAARPTSMARL